MEDDDDDEDKQEGVGLQRVAFARFVEICGDDYAIAFLRERVERQVNRVLGLLKGYTDLEDSLELSVILQVFLFLGRKHGVSNAEMRQVFQMGLLKYGENAIEEVGVQVYE